VKQQDSQFLNTFSVVIGSLLALTILLFALARVVGAMTQREQLRSDPDYTAGVAQNITPFARVAVAGQDNSALAIVETRPSAGGTGPAIPETADAAYELACKTCHGAGIAGAPKVGDRAAWAPRIAEGKETLYKHAIEGFAGKTGVMPAKGGHANWPDELIRAAVDHMVELEK